MEVVAKRFKAAGAHYVIDSVGELDKLIPKINLRLANGDF
jgi:phosphonoacetaldehyde hydrolase